MNVEARRAFWEAAFLSYEASPATCAAFLSYEASPATCAEWADKALAEWIKRFDEPVPAPAPPNPTPPAPPDTPEPDVKARPFGSVVFFGGKAMRKQRCSGEGACVACERLGFHLEPL